MSAVLIIVIAVLFVLVAVVSVKGRRGRQAVREHESAEARVTAGEAVAQHERSLDRQAGVKAAHAEDVSRAGRETDE